MIFSTMLASPKQLATLNTPGSGTKRLLKEGYDLVFSGSDVHMLRQAMLKDAEGSERLIEQLHDSA